MGQYITVGKCNYFTSKVTHFLTFIGCGQIAMNIITCKGSVFCFILKHNYKLTLSRKVVILTHCEISQISEII